jgi:hypothetical protein
MRVFDDGRQLDAWMAAPGTVQSGHCWWWLLPQIL